MVALGKIFIRQVGLRPNVLVGRKLWKDQVCYIFASVQGISFVYAEFSWISEVQGVHKVLHTLKIFISQKPHKVETLHFRQ